MRKSGMSINSAKSDARAYETNIQSIRERYEKWVLIMVLIAVDRGESVVCRIAGWAFCGGKWVLSVLTKNLANKFAYWVHFLTFAFFIKYYQAS